MENPNTEGAAKLHSRIISMWTLHCSKRVYTRLHFLPILFEN